MHGDYYFDAVTKILNALNAEGEEATVMVRALHLGCVALGQLVRDLKPGGDLQWAIQHLAQIQRSQHDDEIRAAKGAKNLLETFLIAEERALHKAEVSMQVINFIRGQARDAMDVIDDAAPNWERLTQGVSELKDQVCSAADYLKRGETNRHLAKKSAYVLAGAGTVSLNASVDAVTTLGLLPWMTVLSGTLGGTLFSQGLSLPKPKFD